MVEIGVDIVKAKNLLDSGEVVAIPTETVYGLGGNALDPLAVAKIFEAKNRPFFNPLILHIKSTDQLLNYVSKVPDTAKLLVDKFWPGPLTLLLPKKDNVPDIVTAGSELVAIRNPDHEITSSLLASLDYPLAAPSANPFGYISPVTAKHVADQLGEKIKYILDGGTCPVGLESTIVGFDKQKVLVYRLGGVSIEALEAVVGKVELIKKSTDSPQTSGMLKSHYSPSKELVLVNDLNSLEINQDMAVITFGQVNKSFPLRQEFNLSKDGNYAEAATNLFPLLHTLDESDFNKIIALILPEENLGRAINDRLKRASSNY